MSEDADVVMTEAGGEVKAEPTEPTTTTTTTTPTTTTTTTTSEGGDAASSPDKGKAEAKDADGDVDMEYVKPDVTVKTESAPAVAVAPDGGVILNFNSLATRVRRVFDSWALDNNDQGLWKGAKIISFAAGGAKDQDAYSKSVAVQLWLFGRELTNTIVTLVRTSSGERVVYMLCAEKKAALLRPAATVFAEQDMNLELIERKREVVDGKKVYDDVTALGSLLAAVTERADGTVCGMPSDGEDDDKEDLAVKWKATLSENGWSFSDASPGLSALFEQKDASDVVNVKLSAGVTCKLMDHIKRAVLKVIDSERNTSHNDLVEHIEERELRKIATELDSEVGGENVVELCYPPILQSGGKYNLRPSAESDDNSITADAIVCSVGGRVNWFCTNAIRTFLINPSTEFERTYNKVLAAHKELIGMIKPRVALKDVYERGRALLGELEGSALKNSGFGMGLEFREGNLLINGKTNKTAKKGMVFNLTLGLKNIPAGERENAREGGPWNPNSNYAVWLGDTVLVTETGCEVLTSAVESDLDSISFQMEEDVADDDVIAADNGVVLGSRTRGQGDKLDATDEERIRQHQLALARKKQEEAERRYALAKAAEEEKAAQGGDSNIKEVNAYANPRLFPKRLASKRGQLFVDEDREAILAPMFGQPVPFHISVIKNVSKHVDGKYTYLRINFITPGQAFGHAVEFENPNATFVRELTFRSEDPHNLNMVHRQINELRKRVKNRLRDEQEQADLVEQPSLKLKNKGKRAQLNDVGIRPNLAGRRTRGLLEAHLNGLRFTARKGERLDIVYQNIKHAFFQPADNELIVLIHFHLHAPIMVGKKKTRDIQFMTEVTEGVTNLNKQRRNMYDRDEIEDEQRERELRHKLNAEFKKFVGLVEQQAAKYAQSTGKTKHNVEFDIPYRDLGFYGVPLKSTVLLQPTIHCLVHLVEGPPFFVLSLDEVEIASFERVSFSVRNFDLVFVLKDYSKKVVPVNAIPMTHLDTIKEWLDSANIKFYEGKVNLSWTNIMKLIRKDPVEFFETGGWSFMEAEEDDDDEIVSEGSEFVPSGESETESEEYMSEDEDVSEDSVVEESSDASEGKDWEELERQALKEERRKKKKRGSDY